MPDEPIETDYVEHDHSIWTQNHGNILLGITILIAALGCAFIAYRQLQFVEPAFPSTEMFPDPDAVNQPSSELPPSDAQRSVDSSISQAQLMRALAIANVPIVTITVSGATNDVGAMMIAIYDSSEGFDDPDKAVLKGYELIIKGVTKVRIPWASLPERFAIAAYHDEDANGELNKGPLGAPTEKYGFSNQARGLIGAPAYSQAEIQRPSQNSEISVVVK